MAGVSVAVFRRDTYWGLRGANAQNNSRELSAAFRGHQCVRPGRDACGTSWGSSGANSKVECRNGPVSPRFVCRTNDVSDYPQYCCTVRVGKRGRAVFLSLLLVTSHAAMWGFCADKYTYACCCGAGNIETEGIFVGTRGLNWFLVAGAWAPHLP